MKKLWNVSHILLISSLVAKIASAQDKQIDLGVATGFNKINRGSSLSRIRYSSTFGMTENSDTSVAVYIKKCLFLLERSRKLGC